LIISVVSEPHLGQWLTSCFKDLAKLMKGKILVSHDTHNIVINLSLICLTAMKERLTQAKLNITKGHPPSKGFNDQASMAINTNSIITCDKT